MQYFISIWQYLKIVRQNKHTTVIFYTTNFKSAIQSHYLVFLGVLVLETINEIKVRHRLLLCNIANEASA